MAVDNWHHIVHKIGFYAVDQFEIRVFFMDRVHRQHGGRECLHHAVVGDGDRAVPQAVRKFYHRLRVAEAVHTALFGVQMQFYALFRRVIRAFLPCCFQYVVGIEYIVVFVLVIGAVPFDDQRIAYR